MRDLFDAVKIAADPDVIDARDLDRVIDMSHRVIDRRQRRL